MKRLVLALLILALAVPAMAFNTSLHRGDKVGILRPSLIDERSFEGNLALIVNRNLLRELRERGVDAVDAEMTFEDLQRDRDRGTADAAYYVEIISSDAAGRPYGGVGVGGANVGVDISMVVSRVAAKLRLYDGRTLELIDSYDMQGKATSILPTSVGIGGRHVGLWVAIPFVQSARYRAAARAVAEDAAEAIVEQTRAD